MASCYELLIRTARFRKDSGSAETTFGQNPNGVCNRSCRLTDAQATPDPCTAALIDSPKTIVAVVAVTKGQLPIAAISALTKRRPS